MPDDIELEPHEHRPVSDLRLLRWCALGFFGAVLLGLYVTGMLFDYRGWAIAGFGAAVGFCVYGGFPRYFNQR